MNAELLEIGRMINDNDWYVRLNNYKKLKGRYDYPIEWIFNGLNDPNAWVRYESIRLFKSYSSNGVMLPTEWIELALADAYWMTRSTAVECFYGRNIPIEWIERALHDESPEVVFEAGIYLLHKYKEDRESM